MSPIVNLGYDLLEPGESFVQSTALPAGEYFVDLGQCWPSCTGWDDCPIVYDLLLNFEPTAKPEQDNEPNHAVYDATFLRSPRTAPIDISGYVGPADPVDTFEFTVDAESVLKVTLRGINDRVGLELHPKLPFFDPTSNLLVMGSRPSDLTGEEKTIRMPAWTYYVRVLDDGKLGTNYELRVELVE